MSQIFPIFKPIGQTPLQTIDEFRQKFPEYADQKISYAGRLDPMAEGLLLLVVGYQKGKEELLHLDKIYEFSLILGIETDTYDLLGKVTRKEESFNEQQKSSELHSSLHNFEGKIKQEYPAYSSKTVNGKQLFEYARTNALDQITIPTKDVTISYIKHVDSTQVTKGELERSTIDKIELVTGDFRQAEIIQDWKKYFADTLRNDFVIQTFQVQCTSGTYVRSLVHRMGKELGVGAVTYSIRRIKVGEYEIKDAIQL